MGEFPSMLAKASVLMLAMISGVSDALRADDSDFALWESEAS